MQHHYLKYSNKNIHRAILSWVEKDLEINISEQRCIDSTFFDTDNDVLSIFKDDYNNIYITTRDQTYANDREKRSLDYKSVSLRDFIFLYKKHRCEIQKAHLTHFK